MAKATNKKQKTTKKPANQSKKSTQPNQQRQAKPRYAPSKSTAIVLPSHLPERSDSYLEMFQRLVNEIPRDKNGFLKALLDHEMIPPDFQSRDNADRKNHVEAATIEVTSVEGYPAFEFHKPIWAQLPNEPNDYFEAFHHYLFSHERSLEAANALLPNHSAYSLKEIYILFFWNERSRAYDIFRPVAASRLREQRALIMTDAHFNITNELMRTLMEEVQHRAKEEKGRPFSGMQIRDLFISVKDTMELQRVNNGLPAKGPPTHVIGQPAPFSSMDRNIREAAEHYNGNTDGAETEAVKMRREIDKAIAANPETVEQMQQQVLDMMEKARDAMNSADNEEKERKEGRSGS